MLEKHSRHRSYLVYVLKSVVQIEKWQHCGAFISKDLQEVKKVVLNDQLKPGSYCTKCSQKGTCGGRCAGSCTVTATEHSLHKRLWVGLSCTFSKVIDYHRRNPLGFFLQGQASSCTWK